MFRLVFESEFLIYEEDFRQRAGDIRAFEQPSTYSVTR
jgi:hypothetical protein